MTSGKDLFTRLIKSVRKNNAHEIILEAGSVPVVQICGKTVRTRLEPLSDQQFTEIRDLCTNAANSIYPLSPEKQEILGSLFIKDLANIRFTLFRCAGVEKLIARVLPYRSEDLNNYRIPDKLKEIVKQDSGLIIVGGESCSGKSTTAASLLQYFNEYQNRHCLTIERVLEFPFKAKHSNFTRILVGSDCDSVNQALLNCQYKAATVVYVNRIEDSQTINHCLDLAESGKLVIVEINSPDVYSALNGIIASHAANQNGYFRRRLARNLKAIIMHMLVPAYNYKRVVSIYEFFLTRPRISDEIESSSAFDAINEMLREGYQAGISQTFDQDFVSCYANGQIDEAGANHYIAMVSGLSTDELVLLANSINADANTSQSQQEQEFAKLSPSVSLQSNVTDGSAESKNIDEHFIPASAPPAEPSERVKIIESLNEVKPTENRSETDTSGQEHIESLSEQKHTRLTNMIHEIEAKKGQGFTQLLGGQENQFEPTNAKIELNIGSEDREAFNQKNAEKNKKRKAG